MNEDLPICRVCRNIIGVRGHAESVRERLLSAKICPNCDHWITLWQGRDNPTHVRIDGQHYIYGNHLQDARVTAETTLVELAKQLKHQTGLGMGGSKVLIKFNDGRMIITNDLWHQGNVPKDFQLVLPNNATEMVAIS